MYDILDIAKWFLSKDSMSHKKLQKLCYYAYSWYIYLYNDNINFLDNKLFEGDFQAWVHGPVNIKLYNNYKDYKSNDVINRIDNIDIPFDTETISFLKDVYRVYGKYSGDQLELQTHNETPFKNARKGLKAWESSNIAIKDIDMFKEYSVRK